MTLRNVIILPGIATVPTDRMAGQAARWKSGDKVRFFNGLPQKIGGWQKSTVNTFIGKVRGTAEWPTLAAEKFIGAGSHLKLYVYKGGTFYDVTPLRSSGTLGNNPFTTTNGSAIVSVAHTSHGNLLGDYVHFSGATAVGGITIDGQYIVTEVVDANTYKITHSIVASSGATGGGAAVTFQYEIHVGTADSIYGLGWGAGTWSLGTWGTARTISNFLQNARTWKLDNWGEDLIANYRKGGIYFWDASVGTGTRATLIGAAPVTARGIFVSPEQRILVAYGAHDGTADDAMRVRWSDSENYNQWTPDVITNVAGSKRLDKGNELLAHAKTRSGTLIFSDAFVWMMSFVGPPDTFGWTPMGSNGSIVGPNAVVEVDGLVFWMANKNFYLYDGSLRIIPCDVHNTVFDDLNFIQKDKVWAGSNLFFTEAWWLYPSRASLECDRYVLYNYREGTWSIGTLDRTVFVGDSKLFQTPYAFGIDGYLYDHEFGVNADGATMNDYLESGDIEIQEGDQIMRVRKLIPDFKVLAGSIGITLKGRKYPQRVEQFTKGPFTVNSGTAFVNPKIRARQIAVRLSANALNANWRTGTFRMELTPSGRR